jgi:hypothetical protein
MGYRPDHVTSDMLNQSEDEAPPVHVHCGSSGPDTNISIWPSRVARNVKHVKTNAPEPGSKEKPPVYNQTTKTVAVPLNDSAYDRTVRLNAALHALYSKTQPYTHLEEALEEARLHMIHAQTTGTPRRDELNTALRDLRNTAKFVVRDFGSKDMAMLTTVRALAILRGGGTKNPERIDRAIKKCVAPYLDKDALPAIHKALDLLESKPAEAKEILQPYFKEFKQPPPCQFPMAGQCKGDRPMNMPMSGIEGMQAVMDGIISTESADMLSPSTVVQLLKESWLPKMEVVKLTDTNAIRTCFGIQERTAMSGIKIKAKKLALIVGPNLPRIFTKPIDRENGGTVLIDASGSMSFTNEHLKAICDMLPMATVAYYDSYSDDCQPGYRPDKLHVYSEKGLRSTVTHLPRCGGCNMIDFPAIQWLLKQPGPRWFLTDGGFTGPEGAAAAAHELSQNAHKRKIIKLVRSINTIINDIRKKQGKL